MVRITGLSRRTYTRRRASKRKTPYKRRSTSRRSRTVSDAVKRYVKRAIQHDKEPERLRLNLSVTSHWNGIVITSPYDSITDALRDGRSVNIGHLRCRGTIYCPAGSRSMRMVWLIWKPDTADDAFGGATDVFEYSGDAYAPQQPFRLNANDRSKFIVKYDQTFYPAEFTGLMPHKHYDFTIPINKKMHFNNTTGVDGKNKLYGLCMGDLAANAISTRMTYTLHWTDSVGKD